MPYELDIEHVILNLNNLMTKQTNNNFKSVKTTILDENMNMRVCGPS